MQLLLRVVDATLQPGEIIALLKTWYHLGLNGKIFFKGSKENQYIEEKRNE